ncbi:MAG: protein kinase [candidate division Zixibacteria bacterium]|nr:protein kinase [candidate division Zixibacteria bacterium]
MVADESDNDRTRSFVALTAGANVSHYKIIEKIGAGGMGEVYLAEDTKLNRRVALKFLPLHLCQDDDCRARFTREAQAAAGLDHPNIASIHEVGEYNGRPFFSMQVVEGQSLREVIAAKDVPTERILEIAIQVCEGLQAAHDKGIVHRDIKPSNILVDGHGRVRIVDFGLASVVGTDQLTKTGSTLGTIGYMSPEQVRGEEIDHRTDLFSLGVVLYELITKHNPFKRDSEAATLKAVNDDLPNPLARFKSGLPDGLQSIVDKALEKDANTRYQHADGILSDLIRLKRSLDSGQSIVSATSPVHRSMRTWLIAVILAAAVAVIALIVTKPWITETASDEPDKIMLAVLPFENLGDPEDEYFAVGITDEITARLAKVLGIGVIARTSSMRYKATDKSIQQIGDELGVEYVLEGTVRWQAGDRTSSQVRVTPQLIRVADESHVWAEIYDGLLTEVFTVQGDIAAKVVSALDVTLIEREREMLREAPTDNLEAYDYYLRGREYWHRFDRELDLMEGLAVLEQAVKLDTTYANAYTDISCIHSFLYWGGYDISDERLELAWRAATKAREYDSLDSYSHLALGYYYYYGSRDYERALEHFERALEGSPNSADIWAGIGYVKRRMGLWEESLDAQKTAMKLDPLSTTIRQDVVSTTRYMRRYTEALDIVERGLALFPHHSELLYQKTMVHLTGEADPVPALNALNELPLDQGNQYKIGRARYDAHVYLRDYDSALSAALDIRMASSYPTDTASYYNAIGQVYQLLGKNEKSRIWLDSARVYIRSLHDRGFLKIGWLPPGLGPVLARLGRHEEAIKAAREEAATISLSVDALVGTNCLTNLARTYAIIGQYDAAIDIIDTLLSVPADISVQVLRHHPDWDPLRDHPRFQALIAKYEKEHGT